VTGDERGSASAAADGGAGADLRASDAERDMVAAELGEHFQAGRLRQDEFDERVSAALAATTRRDLASLLADLPPREPGQVTQPAGGPPRRPSWAGYLPLAVPVLFVAVVAGGIAAHAGGPHGPHHWAGPWPLLWLWWAIPVAVIWMRRRLDRSARGGEGPGSWR
jgi:hypothetical protein